VLDLDHFECKAGVFDYGRHGLLRYCHKEAQKAQKHTLITMWNVCLFSQCALYAFLWHAERDGSE